LFYGELKIGRVKLAETNYEVIGFILEKCNGRVVVELKLTES
jgi:hypothetical protein